MNIKRQYFQVLITFSSLLILLFFNTCQEIDFTRELTREALVQTNSSSVGSGVVTLTGTIIDLGEGITDHGFVISNSAGGTISSGQTLSLGGASKAGQFTYDLSEVSGGATLYFRAYASSGGETIYGDSKNFSTPGLIVTTQTASILSKSSATLYGRISNPGFKPVTDHGFYWATDPTPQNFSQNKVSLGNVTDASTFNYTLTDFLPYTTYYFVSYAENESETKFGTVRSFKIENIWTQIANLSGERSSAMAFSLGESGYIVGGRNVSGHIDNFCRFTPDPSNWSITSTAVPPVGSTAFTIGNKAYIIWGNYLYEYDLNNGMWVDKATFPGSESYSVFAFSIGNKGYIGSGAFWDGSQNVYVNDFWEFDPQDEITKGTDINGDPLGSWVQKADFPGTGMADGAGFSIAAYGYVCSGYSEGDLNDLWQYDPFSTDNGTDVNDNPKGKWTQKTDYPGPGGYHVVSFVIRFKAYAFNVDELWQYDAVTDTWTQMADFPGHLREASAGFSINNKGYIGTGYYYDGGDVYLDDFWEYLPPQEGKK